MTNLKRNRYGTVGASACVHAVDLSDPCRTCEERFLRWSFYGNDDPPTLAGQTDYGAGIQIPREDATPERLARLMGNDDAE